MAAAQPETRRTRIELRAGVAVGDGRQLSGVALRYGDRARFPWGEERFEPGAFGDLAGVDIILNAGHDAGRPLARTPATLTLTDDAESLRFSATLPDTRDAADTLELVRSGVLTSASIEFLAREERQAGPVRVVERATLLGIAVVARGAYPSASVDAREGERSGDEERPERRRKWWR